MQAGQIREGLWYAISTQPRKGVKPENLHKDVGAIYKYKVLRKGVERYAEFAKDSYGDPDGDYKQDGVLVTKDPDVLTQDTKTRILKPRDVLMPWSEYTQRIEQDAAEASAEQAEKERKAKEAQEATQAVTERLVDMGLVEYANYSQMNDFRTINDRSVVMPIESMNRLLDTVSSRVYELLAEADAEAWETRTR